MRLSFEEEKLMAMDKDEVIATLNNLVETCKDGQNGFRTAAEGVKNAELTTLFNTYSQQRGQFAAELQNEVRRSGGDPEETGSTAAALHRGWINIKSAVTGEDEGAVISECERGEDSAVESYEEALKMDLPSDLRAILERQFMKVKEAHDRIRSLEKAKAQPR
ncbi:MAG: PA2169 family four-helix-bundle protein [Acidobacteriota bacterium]|nr:PA2169 family four-helix-bundle protein [Acidobacteriota bacterium]